MFGGRLLALELGPDIHGFVSPVFQVTGQRPNVVQRMENITAAGDLRESLLVPGPEPLGKISDSGIRGEALVDQFHQPDAPGIGVAMLFLTQQKAEGGLGIDSHQNGIARLEYFVEEADLDAGEVVLLVDSPGIKTALCTMLCTVPRGDRVIEEVAKQFDHAGVELWQISTNPRTSCRSQALVTGRSKRTSSGVDEGAKAWSRASWAVCVLADKGTSG